MDDKLSHGLPPVVFVCVCVFLGVGALGGGGGGEVGVTADPMPQESSWDSGMGGHGLLRSTPTSAVSHLWGVCSTWRRPQAPITPLRG